MATKAEVLSYLNDNYHFEAIGDDAFQFGFNLDGGRSQLVFAHLGDGFLFFTSPFATESTIPANLVFKLVQDSLFGVKRAGDYYHLVHLVLLENVDSNEIDVAIRMLANAADKLEKEIGGDQF